MLMMAHPQILLIKMDQIKGIFKANIAKDPFDVIFWSDPNKHTYKQAISLYNTSSQQQKQQIQQRIIRKLSKPKQPKICLSSLLILHYLLSFEARVNPKNLSVHPTLESIKSEKSRLAQEAFLNFYLQFLKSEAAKQTIRVQFKQSCLADQIRFCQIAVEEIMTVIKFDFVILHALNHLEHKQIRQIAVRKVMEDVATNLSILKQFINENWQKILQQDNACFEINQIYQKCLYFSKQSEKLSTLRNKIKLGKQLEFYKLNSETNKQIEQQMACKQEEKKEYMSQKYIRSRKNIGIEIEDRNFDSCPDIISEDSILLASFDI